MKRKSSLLCFLILSLWGYGQQVDLTYQMPPKAIADLVDVPATPAVMLSPDATTLVLMGRPSLPSIAELAEEELRIAGLRINPATNGPSRSSSFNSLTLVPVAGGEERPVSGLPPEPRLENASWSPNGRFLACTNTTETGIELWVVDVMEARARRLTAPILNDALRGSPYEWFSDSRHLIAKVVPSNRGATPQAPKVPKGPVVSVNDGKTAPARTYQDLLENPYDEALFEYYATAQLMIVDATNGTAQAFGDRGIITGLDPSPDGNYLLVTTIHRPFSYLVPYYRFPQTVVVYDRRGQPLQTIAELPLIEEMPTGFDAEPLGPRNIAWRADAPATLYWVEAQDGGDPRQEASIRDQLFLLPAPFSDKPQAGPSFKLRYAGINWGNDGLAITYERWWKDRHLIVSRFAPANPAQPATVLFDRSYEDRYNDPGSFETTTNDYGRRVLLSPDGGKTLFLTGQGASPEGNRPFVDEYDLASGNTKRHWRSEAPYYEYPVSMVDVRAGTVITRRESPEEPPNYFVRNLRTGSLRQLTDFDNPYTVLKGVTKELVRYQRKDGIELTGTLYLPAGYDREKDGPLPTFMWAYPREYKSAAAASQVSGSPYQFIRPGWGSPLFWVTQGYAIFDNFAMPILGEGNQEPNETFVPQLRLNAEAAIDKLVSMGVTDREKIGVGGHSYGAFMTANLLAHTDLFAAGIARSGAYNRTLTPFGFQAEERTFWEAPEIYFSMSPFMHADQVKTPILLIHGEADNNSGTFPIQSERFYAALKGHGATARLVLLPHESHGYRARESVMHMMWEMDQWLDKYVKNKGKVKDAQP